jgi:RNA polymerase sigma-70 factor (ECF subfamily)
LELASNIADRSDIEAALIEKELISYVRRCVKQVPLLYREPLSLFFLEEKSYQEISDILQIPSSTVGTRIKRAKIIIKHLCQNQLN